MKLNKPRYTLFCLVLALLCDSAGAQFFNSGNEPASVKWSQIRTADFRVIYPEGIDSLAREYAVTLERVKSSVGGSLGFYPNQNYGSPLPVVLHPYSVKANGLVSWSPRRMELFTVPDHYSPEAIPWLRQLAIHESRHAAQMQPYAGGALRPLRYIFGDLSPSVLCAIMGGPSAMEGDAVVAETALSTSGRGRSADFLEYLRACLLAGDTRNYWQWRYGSLKNYCPDYYKIGYVMAAGMREYCGFSEWPYFSLTRKIPDSFPMIADSLASTWQKEAVLRAPFMPCDTVTAAESRFVEYTSLREGANGIIARRNGLQEALNIVEMDSSGRWHSISSSNENVSAMKTAPGSGKLFWSEQKNDCRWEMVSYSVIRCLDLSTGKTGTLTRKSRYFNPSVSSDGKRLAVSSILSDGSSSLVILDSEDGKELQSYPAPQGLQVLESTWIGGKVYASALGNDGIGIFCVEDDFRTLLRQNPAKIKELDSHDGAIVFVSDRNGVNELYSLDPLNGKVMQLTSSVQGSSSHCFLDDSLYYASLTPAGRIILRTAVSDLIAKETDYGSETHAWALTDSLSEREPLPVDYESDVEIGEIQAYSRFGHSLKIHSWMPFYANTNIIESLSMDALMTYCGVGVSAYFQNELSTLQGFAGYSAWTPMTGWGNAGHLRFTYSGLYPVFELSANLSDEGSSLTSISLNKEKEEVESAFSLIGPVSFSAGIRTYIPLDFSSNGWSRGVIPQLKWSFNNDRISFLDNTGFSNSLSANVRAYIIHHIPSSCLYPRWGIGVEVGYDTRPGLRNLLLDNVYGYVYGYVPGLWKSHGIKLSILGERNIGSALLVSPFANVAPRGGSSLISELARYKNHGKLTVDYALPFAPVDWSFLSPVTYIRNFELIAHCDLSYYLSKKHRGTVSSVGADIVAKLGNVLFIPYDTRIGVSCCYLSGDMEVNPFYVGMVFSVDI